MSLAHGIHTIDTAFQRDHFDAAYLIVQDGRGAFVDCGTSGGVFGLTRGYALMLGGAVAAIGQSAPVLDTLAPGIAAAPRTPGVPV